jgi:hypothetical protein
MWRQNSSVLSATLNMEKLMDITDTLISNGWTERMILSTANNPRVSGIPVCASGLEQLSVKLIEHLFVMDDPRHHTPL